MWRLAPRAMPATLRAHDGLNGWHRRHCWRGIAVAERELVCHGSRLARHALQLYYYWTDTREEEEEEGVHEVGIEDDFHKDISATGIAVSGWSWPYLSVTERLKCSKGERGGGERQGL